MNVPDASQDSVGLRRRGTCTVGRADPPPWLPRVPSKGGTALHVHGGLAKQLRCCAILRLGR